MSHDELDRNPNYDDSDLSPRDSAGLEPDEREQPDGPDPEQEQCEELDPEQEHAACFPYLLRGVRPWHIDE